MPSGAAVVSSSRQNCAELARVGLLGQDDVPFLVEVVAGDRVVVGVEPLPQLERVVERLVMSARTQNPACSSVVSRWA